MMKTKIIILNEIVIWKFFFKKMMILISIKRKLENMNVSLQDELNLILQKESSSLLKIIDEFNFMK